MPLQNRVTPEGDLIAVSDRGLFMGNRGGRLHGPGRTLGARRWASAAWICCRLDFKGRHRAVWSDGYTELFFLDEPTALAAGHRPCFECRYAAAMAFARCWTVGAGRAERARAGEIDAVLHRERRDGRAKRRHRMPFADLPDGVFVALGSHGAFAVRGGRLLRWTPSGYEGGPTVPAGTVDVLTPPSIVRALAAGYAPLWHGSAEAGNGRS